MLWKGRSTKSENQAMKGQQDFFARIRKDIPEMRKQGAPPDKDATTFSRYQCDLCNKSSPLSDLKQCTLCGRWACPECWTDEFYICRSCHGIVRLHLLLPPQQKGRQRE